MSFFRKMQKELDINPMLGDESESSHRHLLALCDVTAEEFAIF